jgi:tripartite-type tricarboxylate transporter receptor subunit TctC
MTRLHKVCKLFATLVFAAITQFAGAQAFPDRPITLVVPNPPGGLVDTSARILSEPLTRVIGQPVIVDNKPGASGNTAYQYVAKAKPDGYTLLISYSGYHVGNR